MERNDERRSLECEEQTPRPASVSARVFQGHRTPRWVEVCLTVVHQ